MATSLPPDAPRPRLCLIKKRTPEEEYGFNLHAEKSKGQFIGAVDAGSPAEAAGLRPGDRILSVNGVVVVNEPHKQVVSKIKENALRCDLIVVDDETQSWYADRKITIPTDPNFAEVASAKATEFEQANDSTVPSQQYTRTPPPPEKNRVQEYATSTIPAPRPPSYQEALASDSSVAPLRPRLCKLIKPEPTSEFGFNLHAEKNAGHFIGKIDPDSIADLAGLEEGQRIVGVNGALIYPHTPHKDVVSLIKANVLSAELLVASPEVDAWYKQNAQEFSFATAERISHLEAMEHGVIGRDAAHLTKSNGYSNGDSSLGNGGHNEDLVVKETKSLHLESAKGLSDQRSNSDDSQEHSPSSYSRSQPPAPVEPYESIRDNAPVYPPNPQQPDWMKLSAAQLRARVGQHKKPDPRKEPLSLQQKHELIRNM